MRYFPDPLTGWLFLAALTALLGASSYTDERYTRVPKWLTVPALAVGLLLSCLRGGCLAGRGMPMWLFEPQGIALGVLDGALFALAGFLTGFALFFTLWTLGFCGGGDVKLFGALGAWLGPYLVFLVFVVSLFLLTGCLFVVFVVRLLQGKRMLLPGRSAPRPGQLKPKLPSPVVVRFSLVAALATLLVVLWSFRIDLGLAPDRPLRITAEVRSHGG